MVKPETYLQRRIQKALKEEFPDSFWYKTHGGPYQRKGLPDLIGCVQGLYIALEVKVPHNGRTTPLQIAVLDKIRVAGGYALVVTNPEEAIDAVRRALP